MNIIRNIFGAVVLTAMMVVGLPDRGRNLMEHEVSYKFEKS